MWIPFCPFSDINRNLFLLKFEKKHQTLEITISNFINVYNVQLTKEQLTYDFKKENSFIQASDDQVEAYLEEMIEHLRTIHTNIIGSKEGSEIDFVLEKKCDDEVNESIRYRFRMNKMDSTAFFTEITIPSIQTIYFLEKQREMLLNIIQKKDRELEEFRMEKGDISRDDLKTEKFNPECFQINKNMELLNIFAKQENAKFWTSFEKEYGEVKSTNSEVAVEPWNSKPKRKIEYSGKNVVKKGSGIVFKKK